MITTKNLYEVIPLINERDRKRILKSTKWYCAFEKPTRTAIKVHLSSDWDKYRKLLWRGGGIIDTDVVQIFILRENAKKLN